MQVHIARKAGACYGVERALSLVHKAKDHKDCVHTLGPLIHNPLVVQDLEDKGVRVAHEISDVAQGSVVVRSHGVEPKVIDELEDKGLDIIDATCPHVKKAHRAAAALREQGYSVVIVGESGHPEVKGINGHAHYEAHIIGSLDELRDVKLGKKVGVVVQTTQSQDLLREVVSYLLPRTSELKIHNTICAATTERQFSAQELAEHMDLMLVIGGKNSGNTRRLYEICAQACERTYHIESEDELCAEWFEGIEKVGITAGASTPAEHIDSLVAALHALDVH